MLDWAQVERFGINLITLKFFCILHYFLQHKVCCIDLANTVALNTGIFVLPSLIYPYCFIVYKPKDAKVSFKN